MDSRLSESESVNGAESLLSSSPGAASTSSRERLDSDSSDRQTRFVLPGSAGSPPKILTFDEVRDAIKNVEDMQLAHEIAINPNFRLQPYDPPETSLEKRIKSIMQDAFWDLLREQLSSDPPCYDHAIALLGDIKEGFTHTISKNNQKALDRICEVLDEKVIRQQAEQGVLDFKAYSSFIIQLMAKSCAPIRDEEINKLNEIDDVVQTFRRILEVMDLMKLDMANCLLDAARREVITHSVEYEKLKFKEFLKAYPGGFPATEAWLLRNKCIDNNERHAKAITLINAYMEFLDWNSENEYPEIMSMDRERLQELAGRALRLCCIASAVAIASSVPVIGQQTANRLALLNQVKILLENVSSDKDVAEAIENVWLQVKSVIVSKLQEKEQVLSADSENTLKDQILSLGNKEAPVRKLMWRRLVAYVRLVKTNKTVPPVPPGYTDLTDELQSLASTFKRLTVYNYSVFGEHCEKLLDDLSKPSVTDESQNQATTSTNEPVKTSDAST